MKRAIPAADVGSTLTHEKGFKATAVFKTLDRGQYAIAAKNIIMENAKTGETFELGDANPVSSKELFEYQMTMPRDRLNATFPGVVGSFFATRGSWADKDQWIVKFKED